jgi:dihydroflavonol-4-reductase
VRTALRPHLADPALLDRIEVVSADLLSDAGWPAAMAGVTAVLHTASPFPIAQPRDENDVIRPAVDGTLRVLRAAQAAGVTRIILTSSMEAVMHGTRDRAVTEADWSDITAATASAYTKSKTLAERAAWDFADAHPGMQLTAINPGMVVGTPVDARTGSSVSVIKRFFSGRDPVVPDVILPVVDIADVSAMHVTALDRPQTIGHRYICADRFMRMPEISATLKSAWPARRIPTRIAPRPLLRLLGLFDSEVRKILPWLGWTLSLDNRAARRDFAMDFTPAPEAILRTATFLARG